MENNDFIYTDHDLRVLKQRALTDRVCRIALNQYELNSKDVFNRLYMALLASIEANITEKIKDGSFKNVGMAKQINMMLKNMPDLLKTLELLEGKIKKPEQEEESVNTKELLKKVRDGVS